MPVAELDERKEILNADEAGELLGFTGRHIRNLAKAGEIPGRKVGSEWRFSRSLLLAWIRGEETSSPKKPRQAA